MPKFLVPKLSHTRNKSRQMKAVTRGKKLSFIGQLCQGNSVLTWPCLPSHLSSPRTAGCQMPLCWTWLLTMQQDLQAARTSRIFSLWLLNQLCSQASSDLELKRPELPGGHALHFQIGFSALQTHGAQAFRGLKDQFKNCISSPTEFAGPRCQFTPWTFTTIDAPLTLTIITPSASPRADQPD